MALARVSRSGVRRWTRAALLTVGILIAFPLWTPQEAHALPRMSLTAGSPCATCHVSPSGGGMRNELGFTSMNKVATLNFGDMGLDAAHHQETNQLFELISVGADVRYQGVRLGVPTPDGQGGTATPEFEMFWMQMQPYVALHPTDWLTLSASYSFDEGLWADDDDTACQDTWPGMSCYTAEVVAAPSPDLPTVRAGMIVPSIGIRHDDHTILSRSHGQRQPLVPTNYAELGGELSYQPISWLRADVGVYDATNLDDLLNGSSTTADIGDMAYLGRLQWLPQKRFTFGGEEEGDGFDDFDDFDAEPKTPTSFTLNGWLGASVFASGDYRLEHYFAGVGSDFGATLQAELSRSSRTAEIPMTELEITTQTVSVMASYAFWDWLVANARAEVGDADFNGTTFATTQYVAGLEWFPLPFVEVRPEYRYVETDAFKFGQSTVQLHLFY
ncbi:MAG: outer membrane protein [Bradymonadia bacterium]